MKLYSIRQRLCVSPLQTYQPSFAQISRSRIPPCTKYRLVFLPLHLVPSTVGTWAFHKGKQTKGRPFG